MKAARQLLQRLRVAAPRDAIREAAFRIVSTGCIDEHLPGDGEQAQRVLRAVSNALQCGFRAGGTSCDFRRVWDVRFMDDQPVEVDPALADLLAQVEARILPLPPSPFE